MTALGDWHYKWEISTCFDLNIVVGDVLLLPSDSEILFDRHKFMYDIHRYINNIMDDR